MEDADRGRGRPRPLTYQFAASREYWLVLHRNQDGSEGPVLSVECASQTGLWPLVKVCSRRWQIETEFQIEKGEVGLDEYEMRSWRG